MGSNPSTKKGKGNGNKKEKAKSTWMSVPREHTISSPAVSSVQPRQILEGKPARRRDARKRSRKRKSPSSWRALEGPWGSSLGQSSHPFILLPPIQSTLRDILNYISQDAFGPRPSDDVIGSGDCIKPSHTETGLVTMEEIGILVEKSQVRWEIGLFSSNWAWKKGEARPMWGSE